MDDFDDPADLDGDGSFDAIDIMIMEDGDKEQPHLHVAHLVVVLCCGYRCFCRCWMVGSRKKLYRLTRNTPYGLNTTCSVGGFL